MAAMEVTQVPWTREPLPERLRRRSAALQADPKAQEMVHFLGSHSHENRLRQAAGLAREYTPQSLNHNVQVVREIEARENGVVAPTPAGSLQARLQWRDEMDRQLRRLMQDMEFTLDGGIRDSDRDRMRCEQLDKMFDWFTQQAKKEASKERPPPSFLRFDANSPAMPGSLRRDPSLQGSGYASMATTAPSGHSPGGPRPTREQPLPAGLLSSAAQAVVKPQERSGTSMSTKRPGSSQWKLPPSASGRASVVSRGGM